MFLFMNNVNILPYALYDMVYVYMYGIFLEKGIFLHRVHDEDYNEKEEPCVKCIIK